MALVLAPLAVVFVGQPPAGRTFLLELSAALGLVAFAVLALQVVLAARLRGPSAWFGIEVLLRFHRQVGQAALGLVLAHVVLAILDDVARVELLHPGAAPWRAVAGQVALAALAALTGLSLWRARLGTAYGTWRAWHILLGTLVIAGSLVHALGVAHYFASPGERAYLVGLIMLAAFALVHLRYLRPLAAARRPYRVVSVVPERGAAHTIELRAEGHRGDPFRPGQFAWLKLGDLPFALEEHPFSYVSSAAHPERPAFTVKALGDFTSRVDRLAPGTAVLVDGPHGSFRPSRRASGTVSIVGGVGVTPAMSLLRTFADRGDARPHLLVYASRTWQDVTFREELDALRARLRLDVVHVLSAPPAWWTGERGHVDARLLGRHLPADHRTRDVFVCASPPVVDAAMRALAGLGMPARRVHAEQFAA